MSSPREGYVFHSYGPDRYAKHAVVSVQTLRRHDPDRPTALFCPASHRDMLEHNNLADTFDVIETLPEEHRSIVGFKHHLYRFKPFERSLFVDADMIWCRDPDPLWQQFAAFPFTATGLQNADHFFGGPKGLGVFVDMLFRRRKRTLRRFGLTSLPRVQAGMIYAQDGTVTQTVCEQAAEFLAQADRTHFRSRLDEGRSEETCEWSLAMAMRELDLHVFPWLQGRNSPQLDYIGALVDHDRDFEDVTYRFYTSSFVYELRGLPNEALLNTLLGWAEAMPRMGEYVEFTPYVLHFGWLHQKEPFYDFAERVWTRLMGEEQVPRRGAEVEASE